MDQSEDMQTLPTTPAIDSNLDQRGEPNKQIRINTILALSAVALPFSAWLMASLINPKGWLSYDLSSFTGLLFFLLVGYWFVSIPLVIILIVLVLIRRSFIALIITAVFSFLVSMMMFYITVTAEESEFTG